MGKKHDQHFLMEHIYACETCHVFQDESILFSQGQLCMIPIIIRMYDDLCMPLRHSALLNHMHSCHGQTNFCIISGITNSMSDEGNNIKFMF